MDAEGSKSVRFVGRVRPRISEFAAQGVVVRMPSGHSPFHVPEVVAKQPRVDRTAVANVPLDEREGLVRLVRHLALVHRLVALAHTQIEPARGADA